MKTLRIAAFALSVLGAGCSLLLDTADPSQCATDGDCESNAALRTRVCSDGFCVVRVDDRPPVSALDAGQGCVSSELCTQANSNRASVCKRAGGPCTPWENDQCRFRIIGDAWKDPNAIMIGDLQPFTTKQFDGTTRPILYADRVRRAIDLALSEFTTEAPGGLVFPDGKRHPFAVLHCDSNFSPEGARAAMAHLTDTVGVQAMIVGADEDLASIIEEATAKKIAISCSDCIGPLPEGPLAWRILPRLELEAPMAAWRVGQLETELAAGPSPPAVRKVAVFMVPGRASDAFVAALVEKLRFNGKTVLENGSSFSLIKTENPTVTSVNHVKHADDLVAFEPDIIVTAMSADLPTHYIPLIEAKWPAGKRRPYYITTDLNYNIATFLNVIGDDDVRRRISGTRPGYSAALQANIDGFTRRYIQAYSFAQPDGSQSGYDAFYALAYAILAARAQPILDGPHISAGFERLRGGSTLTDFGPAGIPLATALLGQATAKIDVRGLWSDLDWKVPSRDMDQDVTMYCFERDADNNVVLNPNAGPRLETSTGTVTGTYACK